ncbi:Increased DNA methylation 1 [Spatholobus suberectus]|nr:Increased DNA methylation 1 [Spatholobus suberectus]
MESVGCEKIAKQLSAAGWTAFFTPGKQNYKDAAYLSPDGKAHWSITLAYNRLKQRYEAGDGEGEVYEPGFRLTPVPEEDIKIVTEGMDKEGKGQEVVRVDRVHQKVVQQNKKNKKLNEPCPGKRTVLSWMVDMGAIQPRERVCYLDHQRNRALLCGVVAGGCIRCDCCFQSVSVSEFEAHSRSLVSEPLKNICVERGPSLLQCMAQAWNNQDESARKFYHFEDRSLLLVLLTSKLTYVSMTARHSAF